MIKKAIRIVIAEDHGILRKGLIALLGFEQNINVVGEAENGLEAVSLCKKLKPDIVILDVALPLMNGIEASKIILKDSPDIKVIVLSAHMDDGYIEKMMEVGVSAYLVKQCSPGHLTEVIFEVAKGKKFFSPIIASRISILRSEVMDREGVVKGRAQTLSARERQVLQLVAEGSANKKIAADLEISVKTVEKHRQNLMRKLNIHDVAGLTRYAISEGIIENSRHKP